MNKNRIRKTVLSLPLAAVAIAFFMSAATLLPFSGNGIAGTAALVEQSYGYSMEADGKPVAYFRETGDSLSLQGISPADSGKAVTTVLTEGCWVNDMPLMSSCRGRILVPDCSPHADSMVLIINSRIRECIEKEIGRQHRILKTAAAKAAELDYYLSVHNVQDDGFNSMAEYAVRIRAEKEKAERLVIILENALKARHTVIRRNTAYNLIVSRKGKKTLRTACHRTAEEYSHGFITIQTEDKKTPSGVSAIYINGIIRQHAAAGDTVLAAGICGTGTRGFIPEKAVTMISGGRVKDNGRHDMPRLLVPDGAPVFSRYGFFLGISKDGTVTDVRKKKTASNSNRR